jgi:hypothetical protein
VLTRHPIDSVVLSLLALAAAPWLLNGCKGSKCTAASRRLAGLAVAFVAAAHWYTSTLTLLNPRACVLFENDEVIEQPVQVCIPCLTCTGYIP